MDIQLEIENCSICLESMAVCNEDDSAKENIKILSCSHQFHTQCIDTWISSSHDSHDVKTCPLCKQSLTIDDLLNLTTLNDDDQENSKTLVKDVLLCLLILGFIAYLEHLQNISDN